MKCAYHPGREATASCSLCKKAICEECKISKDDKPYCETCLLKAQVVKDSGKPKKQLKQKSQPTQPTQPAQPPGPPGPPQQPPPQPYPYPHHYPYPYQYQYPYPYYPANQTTQQIPEKKGDSSSVIIAGILLIFVGILGLLAPVITFSLYLPSIPLFGARDLSPSIWIFLCFILPLIFSIFAILGGFSTMQRKNFHLAIIGSIFGILSWGFYIGSIISFILLLVIGSSYDEFEKKKK